MIRLLKHIPIGSFQVVVGLLQLSDAFCRLLRFGLELFYLSLQILHARNMLPVKGIKLFLQKKGKKSCDAKHKFSFTTRIHRTNANGSPE